MNPDAGDAPIRTRGLLRRHGDELPPRQNHGGERAAEDATGVDTDGVIGHERFVDDRVAENHALGAAPVVRPERVRAWSLRRPEAFARWRMDALCMQ